jgi:hypothetical protein
MFLESPRHDHFDQFDDFDIVDIVRECWGLVGLVDKNCLFMPFGSFWDMEAAPQSFTSWSSKILCPTKPESSTGSSTFDVTEVTHDAKRLKASTVDIQ